jgi:copper chaperone CopZ
MGISLTIAGMHCGNCVARVAKALTSVPGVEVDSIAIGHASVRLPADGASVDAVIAAVQRAGYTASVAATDAEG